MCLLQVQCLAPLCWEPTMVKVKEPRVLHVCISTVEMTWSGGAALNRTPSGWTKRLEDGGVGA